MRLRLRARLLFALSLLGSAATAYAECAWVFWLEVSGPPTQESVAMHQGRVMQGEKRRVRLGDLRGEPQRFLGVPKRPVRVATRPRGEGRKVQATDAGIVPPVNRCVGSMALNIVLLEAFENVELGALQVAAAV
jgi:hypothetical protein